eukprot:9761-Heterococcus_DN1.PRE.2
MLSAVAYVTLSWVYGRDMITGLRLFLAIGMQLLFDLNAAVDLLLCWHAASVHARTVGNAGTVLSIM